MTSSLPIQLYLVDSFVYAASAVSAASVSHLAFFYCYQRHTDSFEQLALPLAARICLSLVRSANV